MLVGWTTLRLVRVLIGVGWMISCLSSTTLMGGDGGEDGGGVACLSPHT